MVLAAGLGTRLRPLTNDRPKALVTVAGRTLLEITLERLRRFGVTDVMVNAHHFAGQIVDYLNEHGSFGMHVEVSREEELLDTGGGLKKAAPFFAGASADEPFLVHNVDVLSSIDLGRMVAFHREHGCLATLAVQRRESSRALLFDGQGLLRGRRAERDETARPGENLEALAFSGIHVLSPAIFAAIEEQGAFSIIDAYLRLAAKGEGIVAFRADGSYWRDLGQPESIALAAEDMETRRYPEA